MNRINNTSRAIEANVAEFYAGTVDYTTFSTTQRSLWQYAEDHGITADVRDNLLARGVGCACWECLQEEGAAGRKPPN